VPDFASLRDRTAEGWRKRIYTVLSLGWRGAASHWVHYDKAYLLLAGLATGLVISVHSVVSFDFAVSLVRAAHDHLPALLCGGRHLRRVRHGGHGANRLRKTMNLSNLITDNHLDVMNKLILAMSCIMGYAYVMEAGRPGTAPIPTSSTPS